MVHALVSTVLLRIARHKQPASASCRWCQWRKSQAFIYVWQNKISHPQPPPPPFFILVQFVVGNQSCFLKPDNNGWQSPCQRGLMLLRFLQSVLRTKVRSPASIRHIYEEIHGEREKSDCWTEITYSVWVCRLAPCTTKKRQLHRAAMLHHSRITTVIPDVTCCSSERPQLPVFKALLIPDLPAYAWHSCPWNSPFKPVCCADGEGEDNRPPLHFYSCYHHLCAPLPPPPQLCHGHQSWRGRTESIFNLLTVHSGLFPRTPQGLYR